jgi:hypothetical protein
VLNRPSLLPKVRQHFLALMNGYVVHDFLTAEGIDSFITVPHWYVTYEYTISAEVVICRGSSAGLMGAAFLAIVAHQNAAKI